MGELTLPESGSVYLDSNGFIYSIERIDPYRSILDTLWLTISAGKVKVVTSELTLLEVLVKPLKFGDATIATLYRTVLKHTPDVQMLPISQNVLEAAAGLRATLGLKTPDAIHVATALLHKSTLFLTNDNAFRRIADLNVRVLSELIA